MNAKTEIINGTLNPDGTLELDQKPQLTAGRVSVVLRPIEESASTPEGWWPYMQRVRAERESAGYQFMDDAEMDAHIQWLRDDDDRIDGIHREIEQGVGTEEQP